MISSRRCCIFESIEGTSQGLLRRQGVLEYWMYVNAIGAVKFTLKMHVYPNPSDHLSGRTCHIDVYMDMNIDFNVGIRRFH